MFTADTVIDSIQTAKKQFVKTFVSNDVIAKQLNEFVDAQTSYTKDAVKVSTDTATTIGKEVVKAAQDAAKADYVKQATEYYTNFWKEAFKPVTTTKAK
jgi:hypothetical protein